MGPEISPFFKKKSPYRLWGSHNFWLPSFFPKDKTAGASVEYSPHAALKYRMSGAIPLLPLYAFMKLTEKIYLLFLTPIKT
jgi:hypothetical protein